MFKMAIINGKMEILKLTKNFKATNEALFTNTSNKRDCIYVSLRGKKKFKFRLT